MLDSQKMCAKLSLNDLKKLKSQTGSRCQNCIMLFLFYDTDNAELIVTPHKITSCIIQISVFNHLMFLIKYEQVEDKSSDFDINIDSDSNLFNYVHTTCKYYIEESFHTNFVNNNNKNIFLWFILM